jgi:hypothetical protein
VLRAEMIDMIAGCFSTQICGAVVRLGVADAMGSAATSDAVAVAIACPHDTTRRLLRAMCSLGLAAQLDDARFTLTDKGRLLRSDSTHSFRGLAIQWTDRLWHAWGALTEGVRTGKPVVPSGSEGFASLAFDAQAAANFNRGQADRTRGVARAVCEVYDFARFSDCVDVGGGLGTMLAAILRANPSLHGAVFELPHLEAGTLAFLQEEGVGARARFIGGSFFEAVTVRADCYLLKSVLHDWPDEECIAILRNVVATAPLQATVLIVEQVLPQIAVESREERSAFRTDLTMLMATGGRERTQSEFRALLQAGGLTLRNVISNASEFRLLEAVVSNPGHRSG